MSVHKAVLLKESIEGLKLKNGSVIVDATLGGGGHSLEIWKRISPEGRLIAIDQDAEAIGNFKKKIESLGLKPKKEKLLVVKANYSGLGEVLQSLKINSVDGIVADLGLSSDQLDEAERGFSFQKSGPLDMRLDQKSSLTASEVVNTYSEENLRKVIRDFGEEEFASRIARAIVGARQSQKIETTVGLREIVESAIPARYQKRKIHPATKTFQALRIEVNQEEKHLGLFLSQALGSLKKGGRLAVITFHSGEDRIVKAFFRNSARGCVCPSNFPICRCGREAKGRLVNRKAIIPAGGELKENPRARSAKLRILEKV